VESKTYPSTNATALQAKQQSKWFKVPYHKGINNFEARVWNVEKKHIGWFSGRLEVCHMGVWGNVCDKGFNDTDADVMCHIMGFKHGASHWDNTGHGSGITWLNKLKCTGNETKVEQCRNDGWAKHKCANDHTVALECKNSA